ncbi:pyrroline-5-carboxylate reductase [Bacillus sp. HMF5848]|uniref:pyrroline-5-carboxylate reductase n=1 Tax=Bacillus sp. HMF5848 TaxID=2495421 RepID=UPI000F785B19|nr:pyrroline-5-carboxylate reductase [Bacillus sp. HMF5848]RSK26777.1 pyrroline-5-carboxylate reductase [Bacillus sp. HMF5848]
MKKQVGFIGCGNMAIAMIRGMLQSGLVPKEDIYASAVSESTLQGASEALGINVTLNNCEVIDRCSIVFLAVKPYQYADVIHEIMRHTRHDTVLVTIAAGVTIKDVEEFFNKPIKVIRSMPNTPSLVGEGMTALCINKEVSDEEVESVLALFNSFGHVELVEESLMDAIPAISGSSPAYVYIMIEALADGGVRQGIPRDQAYRLAAQAVLGAAKMVLQSDKHPAQLKDEVCTPGGATIEAIAALEEVGFRHAIHMAMDRCTKKASVK